mgnify:CR=1 FL=1
MFPQAAINSFEAVRPSGIAIMSAIDFCFVASVVLDGKSLVDDQAL